MPELLKELHSCSIGGHLGAEKTLQKAQLKYYWYGMQSDVKRWCMSCQDCASSKTTPPMARAPLVQDQVKYPFERIAMDIVGPLTSTQNENRYILVVSDYFTKWPEAFALRDHKAATVAKVLVDEVFCRYGVPAQLHADQGRDFESKLIQEICKLMEIEKTRTTAYHPQSDGLVERLNRTLVQMLRTVGAENQKDWDEKLPKILLAYRSSVHSTTKFTPHFLMFGREVHLPIDIMFGGTEERFQSENQYAKKTQEVLEQAFETVHTNIKQAQQSQKRYYDSKIRGVPLIVGDQVMLYLPAHKKGLSKKLHKCWDGPWTVKKKITEVLYRIHKPGTRRKPVVHFNRLRKYEKWEPHDDTVTQETITKKSEVRPTTNEPQTDHIVQPGTIPHSILIEQRNIPADNIPPDLGEHSDNEDQNPIIVDAPGPVAQPEAIEPELGPGVDAWEPQRTRVGRAINKPPRYEDFVM